MSLIYYKVIILWPNPSGEFTLALNCSENKIIFYVPLDIQNPIATLDINNLDCPIPHVLDFHKKPIAISICHAKKAICTNNFSEIIIHTNCAVNITMQK